MGYETDAERSSVHSGRSSVTEMSKETSQRYMFILMYSILTN